MQHESGKDFKQVVIELHRDRDPEYFNRIKFGPPVSDAQMRELEDRAGGAMPIEFVEIYQQFNGYSEVSSEGMVTEFLLSTNGMLEQASFMEHMLGQSNPGMTEFFLPFWDWGTGEMNGYRVLSAGEFMSGVYLYSLDSHRWVADPEPEEIQEPDEFFMPTGKSLADFLENSLRRFWKIGS